MHWILQIYMKTTVQEMWYIILLEQEMCIFYGHAHQAVMFLQYNIYDIEYVIYII